MLDTLTSRVSRISTDVQTSLRRARVEGERRLLQRQHRTALEELGERAYELVKDGTLPAAPLGAEVAAVEAKLMEIEAKATEIDSMREEEEAAASGAAETGDDDPSRKAFPMVGDRPGDAAEGSSEGGPGAGWEAAERFFKRGS